MTTATAYQEPRHLADTPDIDIYQEYEYLKRHIRDTAKTPEEYERRVQNLADELGI